MDGYEGGTWQLCHVRRLAFYFNISFYLMQHTPLLRSKFRILRINCILLHCTAFIIKFVHDLVIICYASPQFCVFAHDFSKHDILMSALASFKKLQFAWCFLMIFLPFYGDVMYQLNRSFNIIFPPPPPQAYSGHLTPLPSWGGRNLIIRVFQGLGNLNH